MSAPLFRRLAPAGAALSLLAASGPCADAEPQRLHVAAAANMARVIEPLEAGFEALHPEIDLRVSLGASGSLYAQIRHGAPFEVFLSADPDHPAALVQAGEADAATVTPFARGVLVLWPQPPGDAAGWAEVLAAPGRLRIAIPNPDTAPFGRSARMVLREAGIWEAIQSRLVIAENVAQTLHFVESGNADFGFVAGSLLTGRPGAGDGLAFEQDDPSLHHTAVLLRRGAGQEGARVFLGWLLSEEAQAVLLAHGYRGPNRGIDAVP